VVSETNAATLQLISPNSLPILQESYLSVVWMREYEGKKAEIELAIKSEEGEVMLMIGD